MPRDRDTPRPRAWTISAPSWVVPGTVAENCRLLAGRVHDVAVMLLETDACLAYTSGDIAPELARLPAAGGGVLSYHLHLPIDLPWSNGGRAVADVVDALLTVTACLHPWAYVLHAPPEHELLEQFLTRWQQAGRPAATLLLENTADNDVPALLPLVARFGCRLCLDIGHLMAYGQTGLPELPRMRELRQHTAMLHLYAPWEATLSGSANHSGHGHHSLAHLDAQGRSLLGSLLALWPAPTGPRPVLVVEVFDWSALSESLTLLDRWLSCDDEHAAGA